MKTRNTVKIGATIWEVYDWEELRRMGFVNDPNHDGLLRTDSRGWLWSAMSCDGCWSCDIADEEGGWFESGFGDSIEDAIRDALSKERAHLNDTERAAGLAGDIVRAVNGNLSLVETGRSSYSEALNNIIGKVEEILPFLKEAAGRQ